MNRVTLIGRLTKDPDVRYSNTQNGQMCIARYTLAVDRRTQDNAADFIKCVAFGKCGEFAEKYLKKGIKIAVNGRIQTGSYDDKNGNKCYTTDVVIECHEFVESKRNGATTTATSDGFMAIPDDIDEELPFN